MSNRYTLECACGAKTGVSPGQAGQELACQCGRTLSVPLLRELRQLPPFTEPTGAARAAAPSANPEARRSPFLFVSLLLTILSLSASAALLYARSQIDTTWSVEGQRDYDSLMIDSLGPDEIYNAWHDLIHDGLGDKRPDSFMLNGSLYDRVSVLVRWALISSGLFGGLTLVLGLASRRGSGS